MHTPYTLSATPLIHETEIQARINNLAHILNTLFAEVKTLHTVCVMNGAYMFHADLVRKLTAPEIISHFVTSKDSRDSFHFLEDQTVLLVEDIFDTGETLAHLVSYILEYKPAKLISICLLYKKIHSRQYNTYPHYYGFYVPDNFVVGYGLDYQQLYRNLPNIHTLK
jgi:hypoxanthine phosphoribosyltransferase